MKSTTSKSFITVIGLSIYAFLAVGTSMCEEEKRLSTDAEDNLEFIGRVEDFTGNPKNNRLVLIYLNGKEIGRGKTQLGKYEAVEKVPNDGLFTIEVPNIYELSEKDLQNVDYQFGSTGVLSSATNLKMGGRTYIDFTSIKEGENKFMDVNTRKNVRYTIKALPEEFESLPLDIQNSNKSTILTKEGKVVVISDNGVPKTEVEDVKFTGEIEEVKLKEINFPLNNCGGNSEIRQRYNKTESYLHETNFNLGANVKRRYLPALLMGIDLTSYFEARFGFTEKEFSSEIIEYEFTAKPQTNINYKIIWNEIWEHGEAKVYSDDGLITVPFKVKTGLKYEIQAERNTCK